MAFSLRAMRIRDANYGSEYAARQVGQGQSARDYDGGSVNELYWRTFGGVAHSPALPKERLRLPVNPLGALRESPRIFPDLVD